MKTRLNITLEKLKVRKTTLQQKRKQDIDLNLKNQDDSIWLTKASIYSTSRVVNANNGG